MGYLDTIGTLCPELVQLTVGYHSPTSAYDTKTALSIAGSEHVYADNSDDNFKLLEVFVVLGNISCRCKSCDGANS